jgi:hypothetical protein
MLIPPDKYAEAARRSSSVHFMVILVTLLIMAAMGPCIVVYVARPLGDSLRNAVAGNLGEILAIISFLPLLLVVVALPLRLASVVMEFIDRRIGIRCPNCEISLTSQCSSEKVLITRTCCHCNATVLSSEEYTPSRPKENLWRVIPLTIIFAACIAMLIVRHRKEILHEFDWFETTIFIVIAWVSGWRRSVMRRRWQQEAEEDIQDET